MCVSVIVHSGLGRLTASLQNIEFREKMHAMGIIIYLSLPNATSVIAEMDQLFSMYKPKTREATNRVFATKLQDKLAVLRRRRQSRQT